MLQRSEKHIKHQIMSLRSKFGKICCNFEILRLGFVRNAARLKHYTGLKGVENG